MKVIIAGSRSINNIALVELACYQAIQRWKRNGFINYITEIVCGESKGVDQLCHILAAKAKMPVKMFKADPNHPNPQEAEYVRDLKMINYAEALIAVWDGKSPGTKTMIDLAKKKKIKVFVFQLNSGETNSEVQST